MAKGKNSGGGSKNSGKSSGGKKEKTLTNSLLILCGLPGSGKTTIARNFEKAGWVWVNQDSLGSSEECMKLMTKALKKGENVILDRCNAHSKDRKMWTTEAAKLGITNFHCIYLSTPVDVCVERVRNRQNHENLVGDEGEEVIRNFARSMKPPTQYEGFKSTFDVTFESTQEATTFVRDFLANLNP